ncbi:MAG: hypothetical protein ACI935_004155 [Moritella dasanensis]|jgi:hypothetical protein
MANGLFLMIVALIVLSYEYSLCTAVLRSIKMMALDSKLE